MRRIATVFTLLAIIATLALAIPARATAPVEVVSADSFGTKVLQATTPVVVQFDAKWCPYCRKVQPLLGELAADKVGQIAVYRVDIDADFGLAQLFGVQSLPTIVLVKNGMEVDRIEGVPSKAKLYLFAAK